MDADTKKPLYPDRATIQLPSRGLPYGNLIPEGRVDIRPYGTDEEELLVGSGDRFEILNEVIDACLLTRAVPFLDYVTGDRLHLLLQIRQLTVGGEYKVNLVCGNCQGPVAITMNLEKDLSVRALQPADKEPFECTLPVRGTALGLRLLRVRDEADILQYASRPSALLRRGDPTFKFRLSRHIVTIDGSPVDATAALNFIDKMHGKDSLALRQAVDQHDCGPDLVVNTSCARCGAQLRKDVALTEEFFRPSLGPAGV